MTINEKLKIFEKGIYCITSEEHSNGKDNIYVVSKMMEAGIKLVQYREKNKSLLEKYQECIKLRKITADAGAVFIINDHVDLAISVYADGVHLGQDDMPLKAARELTESINLSCWNISSGDNSESRKMIIGVSTHSPAQAEKAIADGADYIGVGPIFRTYTKKDVCDPVGFEYLDYIVKNTHIPFVAIGGIKLHNLNEVLAHGANCISMVTEIVGSEDIPGTINLIRGMMNS